MLFFSFYWERKKTKGVGNKMAIWQRTSLISFFTKKRGILSALNIAWLPHWSRRQSQRVADLFSVVILVSESIATLSLMPRDSEWIFNECAEGQHLILLARRGLTRSAGCDHE